MLIILSEKSPYVSFSRHFTGAESRHDAARDHHYNSEDDEALIREKMHRGKLSRLLPVGELVPVQKRRCLPDGDNVLPCVDDVVSAGVADHIIVRIRGRIAGNG